MRLGGTVAQPDRPQCTVVEVVRRLLDRLGRDPGQPLVVARGQLLVQRPLVRRQEQQLRDGDREVAVRQLHEQAVTVLPVVAQVRQGVLVARFALQFARVGQQQAGDPELVQRDVGERDVLLQLGCPRAPLGEALRRDQRVVTEAQYLFEGGHRCATPSGTT